MKKEFSAYIAGPGVFRPDAIEYGDQLKGICEKYGFKALYPFDNIVNEKNPLKRAKLIKDANAAQLKKADFIIADLNLWRGAEPDSGTVFECSLAEALGKPVFGFTKDFKSIHKEIAQNQGGITENSRGGLQDKNGMFIENFGLPLNCMLCDVKMVEGGFEDCAKYAIKEMNKLVFLKDLSSPKRDTSKRQFDFA